MSRRGASCVLAVTLVASLALSVPAAMAAGGIDPISPPNAFTVGNGLARSTGHLQTVWASDCPPTSGKCATNSGPYMGVFWQRSRSGGGWSTPLRVSPLRAQASRPAIAASGSDVYAAWVSQTRYKRYRASAPRVLSIRASTDEGNTWAGAIALSPAHGRVDYPVIAASGSNAWVVWTDANTGDIRMASSTDDGAHWTTATIGTTTSGQSSGEGFHGYPSIGASGDNVAAVWIADGGGEQDALLSSAGATDWSGPPVPLVLTATSPADLLHYPAVHGADDGLSQRVAIAYTTDDGLDVRAFDGVLLNDPTTVAGPWPETVAGHRYSGACGPAVVPFGAQGIAVTWPGCEDRSGLTDPCNTSSSLARVDLLERESTDDGATWSPTVNVGPSTKTARINEAPSIEVDGSGTVFITWLRRMANWSNYQVVMTTP